MTFQGEHTKLEIDLCNKMMAYFDANHVEYKWQKVTPYGVLDFYLPATKQIIEVKILQIQNAWALRGNQRKRDRRLTGPADRGSAQFTLQGANDEFLDRYSLQARDLLTLAV